MSRDRLSVLVLYDAHSLATEYVRNHLGAMRAHSRHAVYYAAGSGPETDIDVPLEVFDAVLIHFTVRLALNGHLAPRLAAKLVQFRGAKIALVQDEYDMPLVTSHAIRDLGIRTVFTTTREADREEFYPRGIVGQVAFRNCLTGYVAEELARAVRRPVSERSIPVGYRGRLLPYWYGRLGREKAEIGWKVADALSQRGIAHDIAWTEEARIYGPAWHEFLSDCRATLGTESGSNVVDADGTIRAAIEAALAADPDLRFEEAYERFLAPHEGRVKMNQIAPKLFEAIALGTPLILYEGDYSGILEPGRHYIPLRKDMSNIDDVVTRIADTDGLQKLADTAHREIVACGRYSYSAFVQLVDAAIEEAIDHEASRRPSATTTGLVFGIVAARVDGGVWRTQAADVFTAALPYLPPPATKLPPMATKDLPHSDLDRHPLLSGVLRQLWMRLPKERRLRWSARFRPALVHGIIALRHLAGRSDRS